VGEAGSATLIHRKQPEAQDMERELELGTKKWLGGEGGADQRSLTGESEPGADEEEVLDI